jgi:hypothetical protein
LNTSLNAKLEFQSAEVDHWKQECERYVYWTGFVSSYYSILLLYQLLQTQGWNVEIFHCSTGDYYYYNIVWYAISSFRYTVG